MCLPVNQTTKTTGRTSSIARTTTLSTILAGAGMMLACAAGPALIGAFAGGLAVGALGIIGGAIVAAILLTAPLVLRAQRRSASARVCACHVGREETSATA